MGPRRIAAALQGRVHYAWVMVALVFVIILSVVGVRAAPSVLIVPLEQAFGWSRSTISAAISLNILLLGLVGPFSTALLTTLGVKRTILLTLCVLLAATFLSGFISTPWQLFATWGVLVGLASGSGGAGLAATIANRWFTERRGLVVGLLMAANASGQLVFLPVMASLAEHGSWRMVSFVIAGVIAALIPLVALLMAESPAQLKLAPFGSKGEPPAAAAAAPVATQGNPVKLAFGGLATGVRSRDFWLLFSSFFICGFSANGMVGTHLIPYCMDQGIAEVTAAGLLAAMGVFDLIGTTGSGWLTDRFDPRVLLFWYYGLRGLSLLALPFSDFSLVSLGVFAMFYGLDFIATIPPTVALATRAFGRLGAPVIVSWIFCGHQVGASVAALIGGMVRTSTGSYFDAFFGAGLVCLVAAVLVLGIGRGRVTVAMA